MHCFHVPFPDSSTAVGKNPDLLSNRTSKFSEFLLNDYLLNIVRKYGSSAVAKMTSAEVLQQSS